MSTERVEFRVRGKRSHKGVRDDGVEWGNEESAWRTWPPRRADIATLAKTSTDVVVETRTVTFSEARTMSLDELR